MKTFLGFFCFASAFWNFQVLDHFISIDFSKAIFMTRDVNFVSDTLTSCILFAYNNKNKFILAAFATFFHSINFVMAYPLVLNWISLRENNQILIKISCLTTELFENWGSTQYDRWFFKQITWTSKLKQLKKCAAYVKIIFKKYITLMIMYPYHSLQPCISIYFYCP